MSFTHYTIVGHFDPATLTRSSIVPTRPLSETVVETMLAESDVRIADHIEYRDGYLQCCWAGDFAHSIGKLVHEFAYKVAERENCVGAELPSGKIEYPPDAVEVQRRVLAEHQS